MNSWLQPWTGENGSCLPDFDTQMLAQSMQLEDLLGQDQLDFTQEMNQSNFYDELTFGMTIQFSLISVSQLTLGL
jgi:hypothetical protein